MQLMFFATNIFYATNVLCNQCFKQPIYFMQPRFDLLSPAGPECERYDDEGEAEQDGRQDEGEGQILL